MSVQLHTPVQALAWLRERVTGTLHSDSRQLRPGDGFLAWPGAAVDARVHVAQALACGATACLVEQRGAADFAWDDERIATYPQLKAASAEIASGWYANPSAELAVIAVTGTNGKTSSTWWLAQALSNLQQVSPLPCGVIGTLGIGLPPDLVSTGLTTPDPLALQAAFVNFKAQGCKACAIEASSIGIEEYRLSGTQIHTAVLTNVTQDHLDYHGDMAAYAAAKARLFAWPGLRAAVINADDAYGQELAASLDAGRIDVWTVSMRPSPANPARLQAQDIVHRPEGMAFTVVEGAVRLPLTTRLIGAYNIANLLGVIASMRSLGVPLLPAVAACADLTPVPGRMECLSSAGRALVAVDYAHTPDALAQALEALRPQALARGGQLWCVFGCGGDRDHSKRPLMGAVAAAHADRVVVTSDNPRSESMEAIISQILLGLTGNHAVVVEPDRAQAIAQTLAWANAADVVLIAGKGHEAYQEIGQQRLPFSDLAQVRRAFAKAPTDADLGADLTARQVSAWLNPVVQEVGAVAVSTLSFQRVHTDSRSLQAGDLFVALRGEHFDANEFLQQARQKGALAAICQGENAATQLAQAGLPGWVVLDTRQALAQLATHWRAQFSLPLIAVTGSNGKTTVTQMIASILRAWHGELSLATRGNLNNDIGVPLTLLRLRAQHRAAVVELGMNHPGEIARLAAIAQPGVALVNNAQREHLEFMGSVAAVAQENGAVIQALPADGVAVFPLDDAYSRLWHQNAGQRRSLCFGEVALGTQSLEPLVSARRADWLNQAWHVTAATPAGALEYTLHIAGAHNVRNSLAALACALAAGAPLSAIAAGLSNFEPVQGRSRAQLVNYAGQTLTLIDDSYNANPDSVRAAIEVLAALPGPRLLVLGDMGEVGTQGPQFHAEAFALALEKNIENVLVTGDACTQAAMNFESIKCHPEMADLQAAVLATLPAVRSVLVKGSRFMKMERVVQAITEASAKGAAPC